MVHTNIDRPFWFPYYGVVDDAFLKKRLGVVIRRRREQSGFRAGDVAGHLGISETAYRRYETGQRAITPAALARLAPFLGTVAGRLLDEAIEGAEANHPVEVYKINGERLGALLIEEALHSAFRIDLAHFMRSLAQAVKLLARLQTGQLASAKLLLASDLRSEFTHILRFLLSSPEQLAMPHRVAAVAGLQKIYEFSPGTTLTDRSARAHAAYIAASSRLPEARSFVEAAWAGEEDPWVRRSMVRGLARSGLRTDIAERHERELVELPEIQRIDLGFWRFYSGDDKRLEDSLSRSPPATGYGKTINALLYNLIARFPRDDRRFDLRSMATVLGHVGSRAISKEQSQLIQLVVGEEPQEEEARLAWRQLCEVADERLGISRPARRR